MKMTISTLKNSMKKESNKNDNATSTDENAKKVSDKSHFGRSYVYTNRVLQ